MRRVLITGAGGFVGRHCLPALAERGFEVHTAVRTCSAVHAHRVNLLNAGAVVTLVEKVRPTHLLHLGWYTKHGAYWTAPENRLWVAASMKLLHAFARSGGRRAVLAGTCAEYDWAAGVCRESETSLKPATLYGQCKDALRVAATAFAAQTGVSLAWARLFLLYGPHEHPQRLVPSLARALLAGESAPCTWGKHRRDFLHVADAADALAALLDSDVTGPLNLASGEAVTLRSIMERVAAILGRPDLLRPGALPERLDEPALLVADVRRLRETLRWSPRYDLDRGLAQTVAWWKERACATTT